MEDRGIGGIANNAFEADVTNTIKSTDGILHLIDNKLGSISAGDDVKIDIDWERRYSLMRCTRLFIFVFNCGWCCNRWIREVQKSGLILTSQRKD